MLDLLLFLLALSLLPAIRLAATWVERHRDRCPRLDAFRRRLAGEEPRR